MMIRGGHRTGSGGFGPKPSTHTNPRFVCSNPFLPIFLLRFVRVWVFRATGLSSGLCFSKEEILQPGFQM
ncbi:hypothetical protein MTR_8g069277 [Medicago truncatula]|uniref:Uncharacterized protein n=1 Tax=Medicago truncatula TaxID=3880 RepID=A0A072TRK4_MEDTR|nr:hypothetical protein MTR_8g069277 [Medicago truncatula]